MNQYIRDVTSNLEEKQSGRERLQAVMDNLPSIFSFFLNWVSGAGIVATRLLARKAKRWLSPDELEELTLGISEML